MPAKVALDAAGKPTDALRKKLAALGRAHLADRCARRDDGPDRTYVASDGKADYVFLRSLAKGQPLARGLQAALDEAIAQAADPEGDELPARGGYYNDVEVRAAGAPAARAARRATSCRCARSASPPAA